jgi:hypothetical protein
MAEALAIVTAIPACLQIASGFAQLTRFIVKAIRGVRHIPQYILELKDSTRLFELCLRKFVNAARKAYSENKDTQEAQETAEAMNIITSQASILRSKVKALVRDAQGRNFASAWERVISIIRLSFKQPGVQCLQHSLSRLFHETNTLGTGILLETLQTQIDDLRNRNQQIPIELIEKMLVMIKL